MSRFEIKQPAGGGASTVTINNPDNLSAINFGGAKLKLTGTIRDMTLPDALTGRNASGLDTSGVTALAGSDAEQGVSIADAIVNCPDGTSYDFSALQSITGGNADYGSGSAAKLSYAGLGLTTQPNLAAINLIQGKGSYGGQSDNTPVDLDLSGNNWTTLSLPLVTLTDGTEGGNFIGFGTAAGRLLVGGNPNLITLSLNSLTTLGADVGMTLDASMCPALTTLNMTGLTTINAGNNYNNTGSTSNPLITFHGCALSQASVDNFLNKINTANNNQSVSNMIFTIDISGGTNASPGSASSDAYNNLISLGWIIINN